MSLSLLALLGLLTAAPGDDAVKTYPGNWQLYKNDSSCALMREYSGDTILHVSFDGKSVDVTVLDPAVKGISKGTDMKYSVIFLNSSTNSVDTGWGTVNAHSLVLKDGKQGFYFKTSGATFLDDMGKNDRLGIGSGDDVVESLHLDQVGPALDGLKACAPVAAK